MPSKHLLLCALIFVPTSSYAAPLPSCTLVFKTLSSSITLKNVPLARTKTEMNIGLSKRKNVQNGMWFSWSTAEPRVFWMQDTWVDLSVGFFDENGILFNIKHMKKNTLQHHYSDQKAKNALELAQGAFEKIGLRVGSQLLKQQC